MNEKTPEEMFKEQITTEDLSKFGWRILKYMCGVAGIYDTFPETLLLTSMLNSAKNIFMMKEALFTNSPWIM